jgi:ABC-2 type transport system permease protein
MTRPDISIVWQLYWSLRRELWENRSILVAPAAVVVLIIIGSAISVFRLPGRVNALDPSQHHEVIEQPYEFAALLLMFITLVIAFYYCLEAFQSERRDRSILFWKSLPVSDHTTVIAKASVPLLILPLVTFAATVVTHVFMLLLGSAWRVVPVLPMWTGLFFHLVAGHGLWYAPFYGWLLLVSAWARRAPLLWATLPLLALGLVERIAFNTSHFASLLVSRFAGAPAEARVADPMSMTSLAPMQLLNSPGFWLGLAFYVACLAAAAHLRRERGPVS